MIVIRPPIIVLAIAALVGSGSSVPAHNELQSTSSAEARSAALADALRRAGRYVTRFEETFGIVVATETYRQDIRGGGSLPGMPGNVDSTVRHQQTRSEILFMYVPEDGLWVAVRNVLMVKVGSVESWQFVRNAGERLEAILRDRSADRHVRILELAKESARFNIGRLYRNINMPTLTVQFLDPAFQPRFEFAIAGEESIPRAGRAVKLTFVERHTPTIVRSDDQDLPATGSLWILPTDGSVVRTEVSLTLPKSDRAPEVRGTMIVDYHPDATLGVWAPSSMRESYREQGGRGQRIDCTATYTNFRRFETSARIVPPK
jgi:hypothetical protein